MDALDRALGSLPMLDPPVALVDGVLSLVNSTDQLDAIDAAAADMLGLEPPDDLVASVLAAVDRTPQDAAVPAPANKPWWKWGVASLTAIAAASLLFFALPSPDSIGSPADFAVKGIQEDIGPGVSLRMTVVSDGELARLRRGDSYEAGSTLMFRVDDYSEGWLHLVRVDRDGVSLVHTQRSEGGTADLTTTGGALGYELETGESAAVFAVIRHDERLTQGDLASLAGSVDAKTVCDQARALGTRCAAERVEAVR
jgi:hypothetical protein